MKWLLLSLSVFSSIYAYATPGKGTIFTRTGSSLVIGHSIKKIVINDKTTGLLNPIRNDPELLSGDRYGLLVDYLSTENSWISESIQGTRSETSTARVILSSDSKARIIIDPDTYLSAFIKVPGKISSKLKVYCKNKKAEYEGNSVIEGEVIFQDADNNTRLLNITGEKNQEISLPEINSKIVFNEEIIVRDKDFLRVKLSAFHIYRPNHYNVQVARVDGEAFCN